MKAEKTTNQEPYGSSTKQTEKWYCEEKTNFSGSWGKIKISESSEITQFEAKVTDRIYGFIPEESLCWTLNAQIIFFWKSTSPTPFGLSHLLEAFTIHSFSQLLKQGDLLAN